MIQSLNFNWNFIRGFKGEYLNRLPKEAETINLPHNVLDVPYNYFNENDYQIISTYEKYFDVDEDILNKVTVLRFDGFMLKAKIYLNDELLGYFSSGYIPVKIDISNKIKQKNNHLIVILDSKEDINYPPFGFAVDYLTFSGIYREVFLEIHPKTYIDNIFVHGNMDGELTIQLNKIGGSNSFKYYHKLYFLDELIAEFTGLQYKVKNVKLWDIDSPNLYTLKTIISSGDGDEEYITRFGFRNAIFRNDGFYLNNKKVKLVGLNRHQSYPYIGYAANKALQENDANILKFVAGVNVVRTSHYPNSKHFLARCDEIGLLVINEIPGWQHIGNEIWKENFFKNLESMIVEERNHPSLILNGVRIDESQDDHNLYLKANEIAHKLDPYRQTIGVRNFKNSELLEDVYGYNDFINENLFTHGLSNPKSIKSFKSHPYLVSEYMGHMGPTKATSDEKNKCEQTLRHLKVINDNFKYQNIAGAIGWCFADYHTHKDFGSGDHICPHGVFDLYRNKKPAYSAYASQQDNFPVLEILSNMKPGDFANAVFENIYIVTNCDYVKLYKNDEFVKTFRAKENKLKGYKNLKHPPILVDDIVGETFKEDKFNKKYYKKIAEMFSYAAIHGFNHIKLSHKLFLARMMLKYKLSYSELVSYWNKYVGSWGGIAKTYKFVGYKDDKEVKVVTLGPSYIFDLNYEISKNVLINEDTYDSTIINLKYVDSNGSIMGYANKIVKITVTGPLKLVGEQYQSLLGGQLSIYVNSLNKKGFGKIIIELEDIKKEIEIEVR